MTISQINTLQSRADENQPKSYLETIAWKKVNDKALTCFETIVYWFVTLFSCCYPAYERFYNEERAKLFPPAPLLNRIPSPVRTIEPEQNPLPQESPVVTAPEATPNQLPKITRLRFKGELHDFTKNGIAGLAPDTETHKGYNGGSLAQSVTLNGYPVLLYGLPPNSHRDAATYNYFEFLNDTQKIVVREDADKIVIEEYDESSRLANTWIVDVSNLYERTYNDWNGIKQTTQVWITDQTNLNGLKPFNPGVAIPEEPKDNPVGPTPEENISAVTEDDVVEIDLVITPFLRGGQLYDYTREKICSLKIFPETYYKDGENYEYLALKGHKLLLAGDPENDLHNYFENCKIVVKDSFDHPGNVEVLQYNPYFDRVDMTHIVDPDNLYLRTYTMGSINRFDYPYEEGRREIVCVTNRTNLTIPGYLTPYVDSDDESELSEEAIAILKKIEEDLQDLCQSPVRAQKLLTIDGQKIGFIYAPDGNAISLRGIRMEGQVGIISDKPIHDALYDLIVERIPAGLTHAKIAGGSINGRPLLAHFGFENESV